MDQFFGIARSAVNMINHGFKSIRIHFIQTFFDGSFARNRYCHPPRLAEDCLDTKFWGFSPRDVAVELGKAIWQVTWPAASR